MAYQTAVSLSCFIAIVFSFFVKPLSDIIPVAIIDFTCFYPPSLIFISSLYFYNFIWKSKNSSLWNSFILNWEPASAKL